MIAVTPCLFPAEISIDLLWSARTHVSAPHVWLCSVIADVAARLVAQEKAS